jgi:hypothetical protein
LVGGGLFSKALNLKAFLSRHYPKINYTVQRILNVDMQVGKSAILLHQLHLTETRVFAPVVFFSELYLLFYSPPPYYKPYISGGIKNKTE